MIFGKHDQNTLDQLDAVAERAEHVALMADGHLGYHMPIGGVAAYLDEIPVSGVGFDIACGNCAIQTDIKGGDLTPRDWGGIADRIWDEISKGVGVPNENDLSPDKVGHRIFADERWGLIPQGSVRDKLFHKAVDQLGSIGSGNHYVDVFVDENDSVWVGVHFGSRGFGHGVASGFLALSAGGEWGDRAGNDVEGFVDLNAPMGQDYLALMELAGDYAYAGREWVARYVVREILGAGLGDELVHNHHNYAWQENHRGHEYYVVRKGATPAFPGQRGFVGGSMGDNSVILEGVDYRDVEGTDSYFVHLRQQASLFSTVHGAGRVMSRSQAKGKWNRKTGEIKRPGLVSQEMMDEAVEAAGVIRRGGDLDESPHVYRKLADVLEAQGDTINVLHTLRPRVVVMAGRKR